jgi:NitT/TauT family transport system substrate-binding protein
MASAALAATVPPTRAAAQSTPLRAAFAYTDAFGQAGFAEAGGFFKQADLQVQLVTLPNSSSIIAAAAGGALDVGLANPISLTNAIQKGFPFAVIAPAGLFVENKPDGLLVVSKTSTIQSAKDLEGQSVALIELGGIAQTAMTAWLLKNGANPDNVRFLEFPFAAMAPAVQSNRVAAAFVSGPPLEAARPDVRVIGNPYAAIASTWSINLWFSTRQWIAANATTARRFAQAIEKSAPWINSHPADTMAVMKQYAPDHTNGANVYRTPFADHLDVALIQPVLDAALRAGAIKKPMFARDMIVNV